MEVKIPTWVICSFEVAFALLFVVSGLLSLLDLIPKDPFETIIPTTLYLSLSLGYFMAGFLMLLGLGIQRGDLEGSGLVLLIPLLLARGVLQGQLLGWGIESTLSLVFSLVFVGACLGRVYVLMRI